METKTKTEEVLDFSKIRTKLLLPYQQESANSNRMILVERLIFYPEEIELARYDPLRRKLYEIVFSKEFIIGKDIEEIDKQPKFSLFGVYSISSNPNYMKSILNNVFLAGNYLNLEFVCPIYSLPRFENEIVKNIPPFGPEDINLPPSRPCMSFQMNIKGYSSK